MPYVSLGPFGGHLDHYNFNQFTGLPFWDLEPDGASAPGSNDFVLVQPPAGGARVMLHHGFHAPHYLHQDNARFKKLLFELAIGRIASEAAAQAQAPHFLVSASNAFTPGMAGLQPMTLAHYRSDKQLAVYICEGRLGPADGAGEIDGFVAFEWRDGPYPACLDWIVAYHDR